MNNFFAVDPGIDGGWAVVDPMGNLVAAGDIPTVGEGTKRMVAPALFADLVLRHAPASVTVEIAGARPAQGVSSMFRFGVANGVLIGVVGALKLPISFVAPGTWKKHFNLLGKPKEMSRVRAVETWPAEASIYFHAKRDTHRAESALIALWSARVAAGASRSDAP